MGAQIDRILAGYVRGTLLLIPIMATLTTIALMLLGVRYALVLGIVTGILETIPLIGPWSAAGIAIGVALFQAPAPWGWPAWLIAGAIGLTYFVLRMFEDNFIIPHVVGPAENVDFAHEEQPPFWQAVRLVDRSGCSFRSRRPPLRACYCAICTTN